MQPSGFQFVFLLTALAATGSCRRRDIVMRFMVDAG